MNGRIELESELDRGSIFTITLPIRQPSGDAVILDGGQS
jgi:signal transduction histidine kinase